MGKDRVGVCVGVSDAETVAVDVCEFVGVSDGDAPRDSVAVGVGVPVGVCVGVGDGGLQATRTTEPAAPTPVVVGAPPTKATAPTSATRLLLRKDEPPPPPLGYADEP
jgi:hypothetical protein